MILPAAYGSDVGTHLETFSNYLVNAAGGYFVFRTLICVCLADAGIVEAQRKNKNVLVLDFRPAGLSGKMIGCFVNPMLPSRRLGARGRQKRKRLYSIGTKLHGWGS